MPLLDPETPVRDVLLAHPSTLGVLERHRLDYCCGGARSVRAACQRAEADVTTVLAELEQAVARQDTARQDTARQDTAAALAGVPDTLPELIDHIVSTHHRVTTEAIATLPPLARKVASVHGATHPHLCKLSEVVLELFAELEAHMQREERVLFPYLRAVAEAEARGARLARPPFESAARPIHVMRSDHDAAGNLLHEIASLTDGYRVPPEACTSWRALYQGLEAHTKDLMRHVWLENEVLFPRALSLEARVVA